MILECPSCHARFSVADHMIPAGGRTVRCSKCAHAWHVEKTSFSAPVEVPAVPTFAAEVAQSITHETDNTSNSDNFTLPPPQRKFANPGRRASDKQGWRNPKIYKIAAPVLAFTWFALAFITYSPSWSHQPVLGGIYRAFGATPTDGLAFSDVTMERTQEGSRTKFILVGNIHNNAKEPRLLPTVRVLLKDKSNATIWSREYAVNAQLKAGEIYPFRVNNVETSFAKNVSRIVVDLGNSMQLFVR